MMYLVIKMDLDLLKTMLFSYTHAFFCLNFSDIFKIAFTATKHNFDCISIQIFFNFIDP